MPLNIINYKFRDTDLFFWDKSAYLKKKIFIEKYLRHFEGEWAGAPFLLLDWQDELVAELYGWKQKEDGLRRYREASVWIPKGGGKSEFGAALGIDSIRNDDEPAAEAWLGAKNEPQAEVTYKKVFAMIEASPRLKDDFEDSYGLIRHNREIINPFTGEKMKDQGTLGVVPCDGDSFHGKSPHFGHIDEVWNQKNAKFLSAMSKSRRSRRQPIFFRTSTAGRLHNQFAYNLYRSDKKVFENPELNPHMLVKIFEAPEGSDWKDKETWKIANPSIGVTPKWSILEDEFRKAQEDPELEDEFKQFHLNIWVKPTTAWINQTKWAACKEPFELENFYGRECNMALDLSKTTDMTSISLAFEDNSRYFLHNEFFMPRETIRERGFDDQVPYEKWLLEGLIHGCEGSEISQSDVLQRIFELNKLFKIKLFLYDRAFAAYIAAQLEKVLPRVIEFPQNLQTFTPACRFFERLINDKKLVHNNKVLDWQASHVEIFNNYKEQIRPVKPFGERGRYQRIDGIVTSIMCLDPYREGYMVEAPKRSIYEERGLI
jgi:phage terminase large subunit-like protein